MSLATDIKSMYNHTKEVYNSLKVLGSTLPEDKNLENLVPCFDSLPVKKAPIILRQISEEGGTIVLYNKWNGPIKVNETDTIETGGSKEYTFEAGQGGTLKIDADSPTLSSWNTDYTPLNRPFCKYKSYPADANIRFSLDVPDLSDFLIDGHIASDGFFSNFCKSSSVISKITDGSFDTSMITEVGDYFFQDFNSTGLLTSLPEGSFNTENITTVGQYFFNGFNDYGKLVSLPQGSFKIDKITVAPNYFFKSFNAGYTSGSTPDFGTLTSLPAGSFNTENITTVGDGFFAGFNKKGSISSLPSGSFNTSKITTTGRDFFESFNRGGMLASLPVGSFNTTNITNANEIQFMAYFNSVSGGYSGALTRGNSGVSIYAAQPITEFEVSNQSNIAKGAYAYVNAA